MSEPFLSEIKIMSFDYPPKGWAYCNGQFLPINQNQALFALLGTNYGGNGQTTFALPNLQGRTPIHRSDDHTLAQAAGSTAVTISIQQMPAHTHPLMASASNGDAPVPRGVSNGFVLAGTVNQIYSPPTDLTALVANTVTNTGGSQPHTNMMPSLVLNFCIALQGIFPSQN